MEVVTRHPDGGATLRLSRIELISFFNLLRAFLQPSNPQELEWAEKNDQITQVETLAELIGMPRPPRGA